MSGTRTATQAGVVVSEVECSTDIGHNGTSKQGQNDEKTCVVSAWTACFPQLPSL